jgi:hypothetical protein
LAHKKTESGATSARAVEEKIEGFAEDLGRLLGTAQAKASSWLEQRKNIADQLTQIRDTANDYLQRYPVRHPTWSLPYGVAVAGGASRFWEEDGRLQGSDGSREGQAQRRHERGRPGTGCGRTEGPLGEDSGREGEGSKGRRQVGIAHPGDSKPPFRGRFALRLLTVWA